MLKVNILDLLTISDVGYTAVKISNVSIIRFKLRTENGLLHTHGLNQEQY